MGNVRIVWIGSPRCSGRAGGRSDETGRVFCALLLPFRPPSRAHSKLVGAPSVEVIRKASATLRVLSSVDWCALLSRPSSPVRQGIECDGPNAQDVELSHLLDVELERH